jgi:uncharacterized protein YukE
MFVLPDPTELTAIADRIGRHAATTRARALHLGSAVAGTNWRGLAAAAFDAEAHLAISALRGSASRLDDAADALRRHAGRVSVVYDDVRLLGGDALAVMTDTALHPDRLLVDGKRLFSDGAGLVGDAFSLVGI